jgi:hypothetical protein
VSPLQALLEDEHLEVLSDPEDECVSGPAAGTFDAAQRARLCRELVDDHRFGEEIARRLSAALAVAPARDPWPDSAGVVALAGSVAARFALDRSAALCLAVAVTRRLGRQGLRPLGLLD